MPDALLEEAEELVLLLTLLWLELEEELLPSPKKMGPIFVITINSAVIIRIREATRPTTWTGLARPP